MIMDNDTGDQVATGNRFKEWVFGHRYLGFPVGIIAVAITTIAAILGLFKLLLNIEENTRDLELVSAEPYQGDARSEGIILDFMFQNRSNSIEYYQA